MKFRWVLVISALSLVSVLVGCVNSKTVATSGAGFMWVATEGNQVVSAYTVNLSTGGVSQVGNGVATGVNPLAMAITPKGDALFIANNGDNTVSAYTLNSDGSLKALVTASTGPGPIALAINPAGTFLFVANQGNSGVLGQPTTKAGSISVFSISGTTLTEVPNSPFPSALAGEATGNGPAAVVASPSGNYLYVADQFSGNVVAYTYDTSGNIVFLNSYQAGLNPSGVAFSRTVSGSSRDNYLFVADSGSNTVSVFSACVAVTLNCATPSGVLQNAPGSPFGAGTGPVSIVVDPAADFVYAVDKSSFQVSQFAFSPSTGSLSALSPAVISTGSSPVSAGITSSGGWMFVANNGGSNVSAFSVGSDGKLNQATVPQIPLSGQPSAVLVQ